MRRAYRASVDGAVLVASTLLVGLKPADSMPRLMDRYNEHPPSLEQGLWSSLLVLRFWSSIVRMDRRELLKSWQALAGAAAALVAYPSAHFWWRSSRIQDPSAGAWSDLGPPSTIEEGPWQRRALSVERRDRWREESREETVYVRRRGDRLELVSAVCPHNGCLVQFEASGFTCPCHHSLFDAEGRSVEGPSPRSLDRLEWKLERGRVKVRYQRFRPGLAEASPLGA